MAMIQSWTGVFKQSAQVIDVADHAELREALKFPAKVIGSLHSYNDSALFHRVIRLGDEFKYLSIGYDSTLAVGAATQIKDIMQYLLEYNLRLPNSGNFREQTVAGALIGGTHGFGMQASMADMVTTFAGYFRGRDRDIVWRTGQSPSDLRNPDLLAVTDMILKVVPLQSVEVTNCVCRLSDIKPHTTDSARAYAVLPYSGDDPVCTIADYRPATTTKEDGTKQVVDYDGSADEPLYKKGRLPWKWWRLKAWWAIDAFFPPLRRWVQRGLSFIEMKPFTITTHPRDIDALYDPYPGPDGSSLRFSRWAYRPTFTCYNTALFVLPEDVEEVVRFAISESEMIHRTLLRCFIGVRELRDSSNVTFAGNFEGPVSAVDLYCSPKHADKLIALQKRIQDKFWTRPHHGKTV